MKVNFTKSIILLGFIAAINSSLSAQDVYFSSRQESQINATAEDRLIIPDRYKTVSLDTTALLSFLKTVPLESQVAGNRNSAPILSLPMPDGTTRHFQIWETPIMEAPLAAKYPYIRTYTGQGIEDRSASIKLDWTLQGFHAMILSSVTGSIFIDPYARGNKKDYITYFKRDFTHTKGTYVELPPVKEPGVGNRPASPANPLAGVCLGTTLRTYRLALAATGEYTTFQGGTVALALSAMNTSINRVSGVYEIELSIRLVLVANTSSLIYTNAATDPYTNNNGGTMLGQNQTNVTNVIGSANYDIGHVFSTGGGGVAGLGVVCISSQKARGVTGSSAPVGDPFDIDYVAHEMGHQFGGDHTFNSVLGSCSGNGSSSANSEPGSGSTIMAYAGICSSDDLQPHSDANFNAISLNEITAYAFSGSGNGCAVQSATGNTPPTVNAGLDYAIPKSTPFVLTGSATDPNNDPLTYSWEQIDVGGPFGAWNTPSGNAPLFRSFSPVTVPYRYFPQLSDVINNTTTIGEILPSYARTMHFRLTARDNRAGGGGVCFDESNVTVSGSAGPFVVTYPTATGISWSVGEYRTVTWDVAGTTSSPISCSNVTIQLSTDGGLTYPYTILSSTLNDGSEEITVPNYPTTTARIRVMAVGNIFYDISNNNFTILASNPGFTLSQPAPVVLCSGSSASGTVVTNSIAGYTTPITLSALNVPSGANVSFTPNPVTPGNNVTVNFTNLDAVTSGSYNVTIQGVSGSITQDRIIKLTVGANSITTLSNPVNNTIGLGTLPTFNWTAVGGATTYELQISTSPTFIPLTQSIPGITDTTYTLNSALQENTIYYWRVVTTTTCGTGSPSPSNIFKTGLVTCNGNVIASTDVPKAISSSGTPTVNSTLTIPSGSGTTITDVNVVGLVGTHTWIGDLSFTLISPASTNVILFSRICDASRAQNFNLNLDDEASTSTFPCPPTGGVTIQPTDPLSAFDGQNSEGTWTLKVADNADADGGSLTGWGLTFCGITATPIPVTWISFKGNKEGNGTSLLNWSVNEYNNHHYEIERSTDGNTFVKIGEVPALSNGNGNMRQYFYKDLVPVSGINYYRLKQVDIDGRFKYSIVVALDFSRIKTGWIVYPNPAKDVITVAGTQDDRQVDFRLLDAAGKLVYQKKMAVVNRGETVQFPSAELARGMYTLQVTGENTSSSQKVILH